MSGVTSAGSGSPGEPTQVVLPDGETLELLGETGIEARVVGAGYDVRAFLSPYNARIRVLDYAITDFPAMSAALVELARRNRFGKIFVKAKPRNRSGFEAAGFENEATIAGYFRGRDAAVMSRFVEEPRSVPSSSAEDRQNLAALRRPPPPRTVRRLGDGLTCRVATAEDAEEMARLFTETFATYPFPVHDPQFLRHGMETDVVYRLIRDPRGEIVAMASAETAPELENAEMTDFVTRPTQRGQGLAEILLEQLEGDMRARGIANLYSLARAGSVGMNRVFAKLGYRHTGTLVRNCNIGGTLEDMVCWCKVLE